MNGCVGLRKQGQTIYQTIESLYAQAGLYQRLTNITDKKIASFLTSISNLQVQLIRQYEKELPKCSGKQAQLISETLDSTVQQLDDVRNRIFAKVNELNTAYEAKTAGLSEFEKLPFDVLDTIIENIPNKTSISAASKTLQRVVEETPHYATTFIQLLCEDRDAEAADLLKAHPSLATKLYRSPLFNTKSEVLMYKAAEKGLVKVVKRLLSVGRVSPAIYSNQPLRFAARSGQKEVVKLLLADERVDPLASFNGYNSLQLAAREGHLDIVKTLLTDERVDPSADKNKAIIEAAANGHFEIVRELLADPRVNPGDQGNLALLRAVIDGHAKVVATLLADERIRLNDDKGFFRIAVKKGHSQIVRLLLATCRIGWADKHSALIEAAENGYSATVQILLTDPVIYNDPYYYLDCNQIFLEAAKNGHCPLVKLLLANKRVDPASIDSRAIRYAAANGHSKVVALLLKDGRTDPAALNNESIALAAKKGSVEVVKLLLGDKRVDPTANESLALRNAVYNGHEKVVELLLKDGRADPKSNNFLELALHCYYEKTIKLRHSFLADILARDNSAAIVRLILEDKRANPAANNNAALRWAVTYGHFAIAKKLLSDPRVSIWALISSDIYMDLSKKKLEELLDTQTWLVRNAIKAYIGFATLFDK